MPLSAFHFVNETFIYRQNSFFLARINASIDLYTAAKEDVLAIISTDTKSENCEPFRIRVFYGLVFHKGDTISGFEKSYRAFLIALNYRVHIDLLCNLIVQICDDFLSQYLTAFFHRVSNNRITRAIFDKIFDGGNICHELSSLLYLITYLLILLHRFIRLETPTFSEFQCKLSHFSCQSFLLVNYNLFFADLTLTFLNLLFETGDLIICEFMGTLNHTQLFHQPLDLLFLSLCQTFKFSSSI